MNYTDSSQQAIMATRNEERVLVSFTQNKRVQLYGEKADILVHNEETKWNETTRAPQISMFSP